MLRPDHIWFFFTVMLSLALAMSIPPRKPKPQNQANLYISLLADQQNKCSAAINTASRIPTNDEIIQFRLALTSFDPAPCCAAPMPNQNRRLPIERYQGDSICLIVSS